jgi:hypothetical protein
MKKLSNLLRVLLATSLLSVMSLSFLNAQVVGEPTDPAHFIVHRITYLSNYTVSPDGSQEICEHFIIYRVFYLTTGVVGGEG